MRCLSHGTIVVLVIYTGWCAAQDLGGDRIPKPATELQRGRVRSSQSVPAPEAVLRGIVLPYRRLILRAPMDAHVVRMSVQPGDRVTAGQLLVQLQPVRLPQQLLAAQAQHEEIVRALTSLAEGVRQIDRTSSRVRRESGRGGQQLERVLRPPTPRDYTGRVVGENLSIMRSPAREAAIHDIQDGLQQASAAQIRMRAARSRLLSLREELMRAEHAVAATMQLLEKQLPEAAVGAPLDGMVARCLVQESSAVRAGDDLVELIQTDRVKVALWLPADPSATLFGRRDGPWTARVRGPAGDAPWLPAEVGPLSPEPHPQTARTMLELEIDNRDGILHAGMVVDAILEIRDQSFTTGRRTMLR